MWNNLVFDPFFQRKKKKKELNDGKEKEMQSI